jgi:hypothetical protein
MAGLAARCEACGVDDEEAKKAFLRQGRLPMYPNQPQVRAPILCELCRIANIELIRQVRGIVVLKDGEEVPEGAVPVGGEKSTS